MENQISYGLCHQKDGTGKRKQISMSLETSEPVIYLLKQFKYFISTVMLGQSLKIIIN